MIRRRIPPMMISWSRRDLCARSSTSLWSARMWWTGDCWTCSWTALSRSTCVPDWPTCCRNVERPPAPSARGEGGGRGELTLERVDVALQRRLCLSPVRLGRVAIRCGGRFVELQDAQIVEKWREGSPPGARTSTRRRAAASRRSSPNQSSAAASLVADDLNKCVRRLLY